MKDQENEELTKAKGQGEKNLNGENKTSTQMYGIIEVSYHKTMLY